MYLCVVNMIDCVIMKRIHIDLENDYDREESKHVEQNQVEQTKMQV